MNLPVVKMIDTNKEECFVNQVDAEQWKAKGYKPVVDAPAKSVTAAAKVEEAK